MDGRRIDKYQLPVARALFNCSDDEEVDENEQTSETRMQVVDSYSLRVSDNDDRNLFLYHSTPGQAVHPPQFSPLSRRVDAMRINDSMTAFCTPTKKLSESGYDSGAKVPLGLQTPERLSSTRLKSRDLSHALDTCPRIKKRLWDHSYMDLYYDSDDSNTNHSQKRPALINQNKSLSESMFEVQAELGRGSFGIVFQVRSKLDGMTYAMKRSAGRLGAAKCSRMYVVEAANLAKIGCHKNLVRYHWSWVEDSQIHVLCEYCNGGSLQSLIQENTALNKPMSVGDLKILMYQVAKGLLYLHNTGYVHMDIKPANILCNFAHRRTNGELSSGYCSLSKSAESSPTSAAAGLAVYKIGDLGTMEAIDAFPMEEGDSRYLAPEVLVDGYTCKPSTDVFSFGLTMFSAAGGPILPSSGDEWQSIRRGTLLIPESAGCLQELIKAMSSPYPESRPSISSILNDPTLIDCRLNLKKRSGL